MTIFEKLAKRINEELNIEVKTSSLHRTYAGYWLRSAGAFVWEGEVLGFPTLKIGSCESATALLKAEKIKIVEEHFNEIEICSDSRRFNDD